MIANRAEMTLAVAVLLFVFGLWPYYVTALPLIPSSQDEGQTESDLTVVMNVLQSIGTEHNQWEGSNTDVEVQGLLNVLKKVGGALCKTVQDPSALAEAIAQHGQFDEVKTEGVKQFLKKIGANLCNYITKDDEEPTQQGLTVQQQARTSLKKQNNVEMQGFLKTVKKIGSALCRAAYDGSDPSIVLAESVPTLLQMENAEIESIKSFFKQIGSKLCDYVNQENGGSEQPSEQDKSTLFASKTEYQWPNQELSKAEIQGFLRTAKQIGSALCGTIYNRGNPTAIVDSFKLTDEVEIQRFTDFLKRFGSNLCNSFTGDNSEESKQEYTTIKQSSEEVQGFFRKFANRGTVTMQQRFMPVAWIPLNGIGYPHSVPVLKNAEMQGFLSNAKKIGSALCRAAYDREPYALAEGTIPWGRMDEVEAQRFKDFLKRFGSNLCDYITEDNGSRDTTKNDLVQELLDMVE